MKDEDVDLTIVTDSEIYKDDSNTSATKYDKLAKERNLEVCLLVY